MTGITKVFARYIYDSRGNPTVEVELTTNKGMFRAAVPSGASTGSNEATELRDGDSKKWGGKGVTKAVANVNEIIGPALIKSDFKITDQVGIDKFLNKLDGTANKKNLGANAILGVSLAVSRAAAAELNIPLYAYIAKLLGSQNRDGKFIVPIPFQNVLNGGDHAGGLLAFQEFMLVPIRFESFHEALRANSEIYHVLKKNVQKKYGLSAGNVGDEGGVAPDLSSPEEALDIIVSSIEQAGYKGKVYIAIDPASSQFFKGGVYDLNYKDPGNKNARLKPQDMAAKYLDLINKYPIVLLEDPFSEDDWETWSAHFGEISKNVQVVSDDLTVTNTKYIKRAIDEKCANSLLLKVNQIGTLSEAIEAAKMAYDAGWKILVSHRSGETEDTFIADLTVGLGTGQLKSGAPARSERLAKYNQLLRIEQELQDKAVFGGTLFKFLRNV